MVDHYQLCKGQLSVIMLRGSKNMRIQTFLAACDVAGLDRHA